MYKSFIEIISHPREYGVTTFLLGTLFILSVYHFFLYYQSKDKTYLLYSSYTLLIFLAQFWVTKNDFFYYSTHGIRDIIEATHFNKVTIEWIYNVLYFIFIWKFVDIDTQFSRKYKLIKKATSILIATAILMQLVDTFFYNPQFSFVENVYALAVIPIILIMSGFSLKYLFKAKSPIKYYGIFGSISLLVFSLIAFGIMFLDENISMYSPIVFYTGVFIENIGFSLGLGKKQKLIIENQKAMQEELESQLALNKYLKEKLRVKLESEIALKSKTINDLHKKSAEEKIKQLETKYEKELAELKVSSLRSQMNPHFIFNSLNSIKHYIIDNDAKKAIYYLNKFSKLIRKILEGAREQEVTLANELETVKLYLTIENIRFNNEIVIAYDIDERIKVETIKVPPLILQPFLENAIWHGLSSKEGEKKVTISVLQKADTIALIVEDNGIGREKAQLIKAGKVHKNKSIGIDLTIDRMERFIKDYDANYSLEIEDVIKQNNVVGTRVTLNIPLA